MNKILIGSFLLYIILSIFGANAQITFSRDWRPTGKRSGALITNDDEYNIRAAIRYTNLAQAHLNYLLSNPGHDTINDYLNFLGASGEDQIKPSKQIH